MNRRTFFSQALLGSVAAASVGTAVSCIPQPKRYSDRYFYINKGYHQIPKLRLSLDRIVKETVGLRPFRASGPRLNTEELGNKTIVHNYGHGGSGWSLSWGSANVTRNNVLKTGAKEVAILGCGTIGITTAKMLQESGINATIYTKEVPPNVTSNLATGTWSPASRVCDPKVADASFAETWKELTLFSFGRFQSLLGIENLVHWVDEYMVLGKKPDPNAPRRGGEVFHLDGLVPNRVELSSKEHPFKAPFVSRGAGLMFNIPAYLNYHLNSFLLYGGKVKIKAIGSLEDIDALPEKVVVNCMGLGAKTVFNDEELTPVAGQLACLIPQSNVPYKLMTEKAYFISRPDGIYLGGNAVFGSWDTNPSRQETERLVEAIHEVMIGMKG